MPQQLSGVSTFTVKIDGKAVSDAFMYDLVSIVVDTDVNQPDMVTVTLHDDELKWVDDTMLDIGKPIEVSAEAASQGGRSGATGVIFKGEITALEPDFSTAGRSVLLVRGYDRAHRLHRGRHSRSFLNMTDSDIVKKLAQEAGLSTQADATNTQHEYVFQNNQTNFEFIEARARRIGYQVYVDDKTLYFKKGSTARGQGPELIWGETLRGFRPRLTAVNQADEVTVKGWDPKTKQAIEARATKSSGGSEIGAGSDGGQTAKKAFGGTAPAVVATHPVATKNEASAMAQAVYDERNGDFIEAEGDCFGDPRILAGYTMTLSGLGSRFSGTYFVTSATHVFEDDVYETTFRVSGRNPYTLTHLLDQTHENGHANGLAEGVVIGLVTNNEDPDGLGRVKVKFPWLTDEHESAWARIASPMAGAERGFFYLPEVNDEVLVAFEHGDINYPYIVGVLWNGKDKPPTGVANKAVSNGKVNERVLRSRSGHLILLDDTQGKEKIIVRDKTGKNEVIIDSKQNTMTINVQKDYTLDAKGNVDATAGGNVTVDSKGNITVKSKANVSVEAGGNLTVKSTGNMSLQASGMLDIKGSKVSINGSGMAELKSGGITQIQGSMVKLN